MMAIVIAQKISDWVFGHPSVLICQQHFIDLSLEHIETHTDKRPGVMDGPWHCMGNTRWGGTHVHGASASEVSFVELRWPWAASSSGLIVLADPSNIRSNLILLDDHGGRLSDADANIRLLARVVQTPWTDAVAAEITRASNNEL